MWLLVRVVFPFLEKCPKNNYFCRNYSRLKSFKDIIKGEHGRFFIFAAVVFVVFFLILLFGKGNNLINWFGVKREISRQEKQIERYRREIDEMDRKIENLSNDKDALEEFARENFHFAAPGDDVYIIDE